MNAVGSNAAGCVRSKLSRLQITGFWAAWSGWTLDGMDFNFMLGSMIRRYGSPGIPVASTAVAFVAGLLIIPFAIETKEERLPD